MFDQIKSFVKCARERRAAKAHGLALTVGEGKAYDVAVTNAREVLSWRQESPWRRPEASERPKPVRRPK